MKKQINWKAMEAKASKMTISELHYALLDCIKCIELKVDESYYSDEASIYRRELNNR